MPEPIKFEVELDGSSAKRELKSVEDEAKKIEKALNSGNALGGFEKSARGAADAMKDAAKEAEKMAKATKGANDASGRRSERERAAERSVRAEKEMEYYGNRASKGQDSTSIWENHEKNVADFDKIWEEVSKNAEEYRELASQQLGKEYALTEKDYAQAYEAYMESQKSTEEVEPPSDYYSREMSNPELVAMLQEVDNAKAVLADMRRAGLGEGYVDYDEEVEQLKAAQAALEAYRDAQKEEGPKEQDPRERLEALEQLKAGAFNKGIASGSFNDYDSIVEQINAIKSSLGELDSSEEKAGEGATSLGDKLKSAFSSLGKSAGGGVKKIFSGLFKGLGKQVGDTTKRVGQLGGSFKKFLLMGLGIRSVMSMFQKMRGAIKEGINNMAQFNGGNNAVNAAMSEFTSALKTLNNALATAFAPILTAVLPALSALISMLSSAASAIANFLAMITGKSTYTRAKALTEDYAKSLKGAGGGAQDLLSSLDEIKKLNEGGGGGGGGTPIDQMFEEVSVNGGGIFAMLKDAIESSDFTEIGSLLATKIADSLNSIRWDKIKTTAGNIGKSIGTFITGFFTAEGFTESVGRAIAEGLNTALNFVYNLIHHIDFGGIGEALMNGFNTFIKTFNFAQLGQTIYELVSGLLDFVISALETLDISALVDGLFQIISNINWGMLAQKAVHLLFDALKAALELAWDITINIGKFLFRGNEENEQNLIDEFYKTPMGQQLVGLHEDIENAAKIAAEIEINIKMRQGSINNLRTVEQRAGAIFDRIKAIQEKTDITNSDIAEMNSLMAELDSMGLSGLRQAYDDSTGQINLTKDAINSVCEAMLQQYRIAAYQDVLTQAYKDQLDAELALKDAKEAQNELMIRRTQIQAQIERYQNIINDLENQELAIASDMSLSAEERERQIGLIREQIAQAKTDVAQWEAAEAGLNAEIGRGVQEVARLEGEYQDVTEEVGQYEDALEDAVKKAQDMAAEGIETDVTAHVEYDTGKPPTVTVRAIADILEWKDSRRNKTMNFTATVSKISGGNFTMTAFGAATGGILKGGVWRAIPGYAGGTLNSAQMFFARENGIPELVGRIGSNTAVMNNAQIVDTVAAGVYQATVSAFTRLSGVFSAIAHSLSSIPDGLSEAAQVIATRMPRMAMGTEVPPFAFSRDDSGEIKDLLSALLDAMRTQTQVAEQTTPDVHVSIDGREIFSVVKEQAQLETAATGRRVFA